MEPTGRFISLSELALVLTIILLGIIGIKLFGIVYTFLLWIAILIGYIMGFIDHRERNRRQTRGLSARAIGIAFLVVGLMGLTLSLIFPNGQPITTIISIAMIVLGIVFYVILGTLMDAVARSARKDKPGVQK